MNNADEWNYEPTSHEEVQNYENPRIVLPLFLSSPNHVENDDHNKRQVVEDFN